MDQNIPEPPDLSPIPSKPRQNTKTSVTDWFSEGSAVLPVNSARSNHTLMPRKSQPKDTAASHRPGAARSPRGRADRASPALGDPGVRVPREGSPPSSPNGAGAAAVLPHLPAGHRPGARTAPPGRSQQLQEAIGGAGRAGSGPSTTGDIRATSRQTTQQPRPVPDRSHSHSLGAAILPAAVTNPRRPAEKPTFPSSAARQRDQSTPGAAAATNQNRRTPLPHARGGQWELAEALPGGPDPAAASA